MPPKRKRNSSSNLSTQPGVARSHLELHFPELPASPGDLKNGHVLFLFLLNDKNRAETMRKLHSHFPVPPGEEWSSNALQAGLHLLLKKTLMKFKKLTNLKEHDLFSKICDESFLLKKLSEAIPSTKIASSAASGTEPSSAPNPQPSTSGLDDQSLHDTPTCHPPTPSSSGVSTRSKKEVLTPRKERLRKRLEFVSTTKADQSRKYQQKINDLKKRLTTPRRVVNQSLKRKLKALKGKDMEIQELKLKLGGTKMAQELAQTKSELINLKRAHKKLLQTRKEKAKLRYVTLSKYRKLQEKLKDRNEDVKQHEFEKLLLKESLENIEANSDKVPMKIDKKSFSHTMRLHVFDCIISNTPTASIPLLISQIYKRSGRELQQVPQRSTVELMARELGALAELQTAETLLPTKDVTMGFDATTQEEMHINSVHFTTQSSCLAAAVDELAGGTADDYAQHICDTVDNLSATYCYFNDADFHETREKMISNISNTMTDRCAANHAAIRVVNSEWGKTLNELNCHLHPLDSVASSVRSALKHHEESTTHKVFGKDCLAANIIVQMNKLRYKNSKGDPRGFVAFLDDNNIPRGVIPRYRGNRLHIIFHIGGKLVEYYDDFLTLLRTGPSCGGLRAAILHDLTMHQSRSELHVLGILGKHLTGPWMRKFYTSSETELNHVDGIKVVEGVIASLKEAANHPETMLSATEDFFGEQLEIDTTLQALREFDYDEHQFTAMMRSCLQAIIEVLERQYKKYFDVDVTDKLREEVASARSHNIDAEEVMGMFSSLKKKAPNATMCYLSCRMRACKNKTVQYLDQLEEGRKEDVLQKAMRWGRMQRDRRKKKQRELRKEIIRRHKEKEQSHQTKERRKVEKKLKETDLEQVREAFPHLDFSESKCEIVKDVLNGRVVGRKACHAWYEQQKLEVYNAKCEKLKTETYQMAYWSQSEQYDDATDYNISMYRLAADVLYGNLVFC